MTIDDELTKALDAIRIRERSIARHTVLKEIQAFAGDYGHSITKDGATRDVVIVEQLLDFLNSPE